MKLILLGAPGSGKGTLAEIIGRRCHIPTISTGNILRAAMKDGSPVGLRAREYVDGGKLVPDEIIIGIVRERLAGDDCKAGYILDGMPRTIPQAEALERAGIEIDLALSLAMPDEAIVKRMAGRRVCRDCGASYHIVNIPPKAEGVCDKCGGALSARGDDAPEIIRERLAVYHKETEPLEDFYRKRGRLRTVDGQRTLEETTRAVTEALGL
ncbi:MAG: adenylate kinase [Oscillospiraceae bacterium]|jgi:adenylate kinase|nr:adenylate kinase [Oscillospiraceae bacterium]